MIEKQQHDNDTAIVRFRLPAAIIADRVFVVGEFNDWSNDRHEMTRDAAGFVTSLTIPVGRAYRFRYLVDGACWVNDWAADAYTANDFGGDDSVVDLSDPASLAPAQPATSRRARRTKANSTP